MQNPALWEWDSELFAPPSESARKPWDDHSPEYDAQYRRRRARKRTRFARVNPRRETIADPEDFSSEARVTRHVSEARDKYFGAPDVRKRRGDPRLSLPECADLRALADTFGASAECLAQAEEMQRHGLPNKAKRLTLCGRIA